jgi:hypothetical protein
MSSWPLFSFKFFYDHFMTKAMRNIFFYFILNMIILGNLLFFMNKNYLDISLVFWFSSMINIKKKKRTTKSLYETCVIVQFSLDIRCSSCTTSLNFTWSDIKRGCWRLKVGSIQLLIAGTKSKKDTVFGKLLSRLVAAVEIF